MKRALPLALLLGASCLLTSLAQAQTTNLALGQPATASGSYTGGGAYAIEFGNDGIPGTWWNGGTHSAWWQVDLQAQRSIDTILVSSGDGPGYHITFQLSASTDGATWFNVGDTTTRSGPTWTYSVDNPGTMRYIRYTTIGESGSDWASLGELQAVGAVPEPAAFGLMAAGLAAIGLVARRRQQTQRRLDTDRQP